jgi:glycosyltransferase involved in cell wall biosynthesis
MKICLVVHKNYYYDGRVRRYAEALSDAGAQVDILCLRGPADTSNSQSGRIRVFSIPLRHVAQNGRMSFLLEYSAALILFSVWLLVLYAKNRYSVIHVHNMPDFLIFTALGPRIFGAKLVLDIHDPMPEFYQSKYRHQTGNTTVRLMRIQERLSAKLAHAVITANANFKLNLITRGIAASKITVVNNVADLRIFNRDGYNRKHTTTNNNFTLIYPGTIAPRYGLAVAIHAVPVLLSKIPQLRLLIIGPEGTHADELTVLAKQLGVASSVQIQPLIPIDQIPQQIAQADVGIYPALPDAHMSIATPSKVLEYAIMGIPIIASRLKILEDLFGDSAIMFFEAGNVGQFADCVLELFQDPSRRDELVRNADHVFVDSHCWDNERRAYFSVLNDLLGLKDNLAALNE